MISFRSEVKDNPEESQQKMEGNYSFSSYHNGGPGREKDFQKLAQTVGTSIQKISQNGKPFM
jgi:hypothetical protein